MASVEDALFMAYIVRNGETDPYDYAYLDGISDWEDASAAALKWGDLVASQGLTCTTFLYVRRGIESKFLKEWTVD